MREDKDYVAIIDIGSNAVRLVVFDGFNRAPFRIHSERSICNLGADLSRTGHLSPEGVNKALTAIRRFSGLLQAMKISDIRAVATAAVRDAKDGKDFIATLRKDFGLSVTVIDGEEEARLSALGVLAGGLGSSAAGKNGVSTDGMIGDFGGGSLELIVMEEGEVMQKASLPLGSHRLMAEPSRAARLALIDKHLSATDFLSDCEGMDFYAMGGAWRSMATAHMHMNQYPMRLLDHYQMSGAQAIEFAGLLSRQVPAALEKKLGMSKKRLKDMSVAALAMESLFRKIRPARLIFSGTGLREGLIYDRLTPPVQRQDALIVGCAKIARRISRFDDLRGFVILARWMKPLFEEQNEEFMRLVEASCLLSDTGWFEHEEHQARHAFERILVMPFYGIDHPARAFLALVQYFRYKGFNPRDLRHDEAIKPALKMLPARTIDHAAAIGLGLRLGYLLTGGALSLLRQTELEAHGKKLTLHLKSAADTLDADSVHEALNSLAERLGRTGVIAA